ncbi:MAG: heme d1 biosynthesis radical SAM protein NirJ [Alcaligenes faecalis]|nr:heme d1 biosynthesis radical SAM protein NirJ [Alcaligenes faecalis]
MFRISRFVAALHSSVPPTRTSKAPVVIWNLIRRCNLHCSHCYSASTNKDFPGELSYKQACTVMDDLHQFGVRALILSGGEPLLRPDIYDLGRRAKALGMYVGLSSNGTLITEQNIDQIADCGFDYVGISLDGLQARHDRIRGEKGAYAASLHGLRLCREKQLKVGLRFTLTQENAVDLNGLLAVMDREQIDRFYLSHLNYAGRGLGNRSLASHHAVTRQAMEQLFTTCMAYQKAGKPKEFTSGNNDADGVFFLHWIRRHYPEQAPKILNMLRQWGGNSSGQGIANIDNRGNVHPDTMWWHYSLGNVLQRPFSEIWSNDQEPLLAGLRQRPRPVQGRCAGCAYLDICNGNTRTRAEKSTGNVWAEDPGCYLNDQEITA